MPCFYQDEEQYMGDLIMSNGSRKHEAIRWFEEIGMGDVAIVGGKTASLGEMYQKLSAKGLRIPNGFGVTAAAYWQYLEENDLKKSIKATIEAADLDDPNQLQQAGRQIRQALLNASIPEGLKKQITSAYQQLCGTDANKSVAIRSSATAEDLPDASFAGQQETYLNVRTEKMLLATCKQCFASLFTDRAISYRHHKGFDHFDVALSICVQLMVRSDLATSGVMFSIDTESGFQDAVLINASYGLGENIVQGSVNPDEFVVYKPTLKSGKRPILQKHIGSKEYKLIYDLGGSKLVKNVPVASNDRSRPCITDDEILQLAKWACIIEEHYSEVYGRRTPMDMEWGKDGETGELYILQARPETVQSQKTSSDLSFYKLREKGQVLAKGRAVGEKIGQGVVRVIHDTVVKQVYNMINIA